ncbi:hypothetical protein E4U41_000791 [Claviceps citrina]|nr:hypothetical protein E4U41_000791 [Claviceps citrina]
MSQLRSGLRTIKYCVQFSDREQGKGRQKSYAENRNRRTVFPAEVESTLLDILDNFFKGRAAVIIQRMRMAALLLGLAFHQPNAAPLTIQFTRSRRKWSPGEARGKHTATGKFFRETPPKPNEFHPFTAQVSLRVQGKPEFTTEDWQPSTTHAGFWTTDQAPGKPNLVEGGQLNGFGFTQSTYHMLHCFANLCMMLAWHITGDGQQNDMDVHASHRLLPELNEEPSDTVDYKGLGIP